jgi:hypothetical protein
MSAFDYGVEAGLFSAKGTHFRPKSLEYRRLEYRRFVRAAEAIRFAIEDLPSNVLGGCSLEVAEDRYVGNAIRGLYESVEFPLPRRAKLTAKPSK